jgi:hypothetical protein
VILAFCFCDPLLRELNRSRVFVGAGSLRDGFRLLHRFDLAPRIRGRISAAVPATGERQKELVRLSMFGIAPAAAFRDFDEAECLRLPDRRRNQTRRDAVFHEIQLGHRQAAIVIASMATQLDLDPGNDTMGR